MKNAILLFCLLPSACCLVPGCGYQQNNATDTSGKSSYKWASLSREDVSTVAFQSARV